jgi:hypothetical protein
MYGMICFVDLSMLLLARTVQAFKNKVFGYFLHSYSLSHLEWSDVMRLCMLNAGQHSRGKVVTSLHSKRVTQTL